MANKNIETNICEAIELIVNHAVENAGYDRTVQATIVSCIDPTIGKYKVNYQDAVFYAYATSSDVKYNNGANVYVLIPGNDTSRDKTIIGTTKKLGINYATVAEGEEAYEYVGTNCIESNKQYNLCSYTDRFVQVIYDKAQGINDVNLNTNNVNRYLHDSSSILIGATFRTSLPVEQQFRGNYGLVFELNFLDNATEKTVTRNYVMDVNQMLGNPYKMRNDTRQYGIFEIDNNNFVDVNRIYLFNYDFPNTATGKDNDIFIKNIELIGNKALTAEELAAAALTFITPQGAYFDVSDGNSAKRTIQAQVRVKGKIIDNNSQLLEYYWFKENIGITTLSEKYNKYGGQGWECLNEYNLVKAGSGTVAPVVQWNAGKYQWVTTKAENLAKENKYKCVAIYNDTIVSKEIVITNYASAYNITIDSDAGTKFYYDIGTPTLTVKINGTVRNDSGFTYLWGMVDNNNNFSSLAETTSDNNAYNAAVAGKANLEARIAAETAMAAASQAQLDEYQNIIDNYNEIMRVEGNKLHKVQINTITKFATYKCSVYYNGSYIGTGSIVLTNSLDAEDAYSLVINNGSQTFKYNESGVAPTSDSIENKYTIPALTFTIYDNLGNPIADDVARKCDIKWIVPDENTLLSIPNGYTPTGEDLVNHNKIYGQYMTFSYNIAERYNVNKKRNNIGLQVTYKGMTLTTETNFTFAKEGEPGTNGTEFLCRIVPNTNNVITDLPMAIYNQATNSWSLNYQPRQNNYWFRVQLWHSGEKIFDGTSTAATSENKNATVVWSMLGNKYKTNVTDINSMSINASTGQCSFGTYNGEASPANIIKATITYDGVVYYATMPLITCRIKNANYGIKLKPDTGFRFATYSADGRTPQYDNSNPFELIVTQLINGYTEDISHLTQGYKVTYNWNIRGRIYNPITNAWREEQHLKLVKSSDTMTTNPIDMKPIDDYDGECLTVGLECILSQNNNEIGRIHIPVHLLLNKYGNAALNGWDGNHISLDEDGTGTILAPQVGAGQKENDNSFTGMLMGKVKEAGRNDDDVGLFGYSSGERTVFINSKNGSALFGKNNGGRIIIDPINDKAMLYSQSYWKNYNKNGKNVGLPTSYGSTNENGEGMLIDLSTPAIKWGNGNFSVDADGHLIAKGGGEIAGWKISDTKLYSAAEVSTGHPKITLDSDLPAVYSNDKTAMTSTRNGFYIGSDGFALGAYNTTRQHNPFQVNNEGALYSDSGQIGGFNIDQYTLIGGSGTSRVGMCSRSGSEWAFWTGADAGADPPFHVGHDGSIYATKGKIGGWDIGPHKLSGGSMNINDEGSMSGSGWSINANGDATFNNVRITQSSYTRQTNLIDFNSFKVYSSGSMYASNGSFGGAIRSGSSITGSSFSGGSISINDGAGHYFNMGVSTDHPNMSGANVGGGGINSTGGIYSAGTISAQSGFSADGHSGRTTSFYSIVSNLSVGTQNISWKTRTMNVHGGLITSFSEPEDHSVNIGG